MAGINWNKKSIILRLTSFVIILVIIQAILLIGTLVAGGVLSQGTENAYQSFYEKVNNRKDYIQKEMKDRWTNMGPYVTQISKNLSDSANNEQFFSSSVQDLIAMLRTTQATGAFIILDNLEESGHPALYIRDYDPLLNDYSNKDLYLVFGSPILAKELKIPMDQFWRYNMRLEDNNRSFYDKPYVKAPLTVNASLLGYWTLPFRLFPGDLPIVTYTMPLFDTDSHLQGVIGVELSVNYLIQSLPATDLQPKDSLGYLIGFKGREDPQIRPVIMTGALQKRMIHEDKTLDLREIDQDRNMYLIENHNNKESIYACVEKIGLYHYNTPFEEEQWYLIGMMTENHLLSYVLKIKGILWISLLASIVIGILGGYFISYRFTRPIIKLARKVRESEKDKAIKLEATGLLEIDELSGAMEMANNALLESTVKMSRIIELVDVPIGAFEYQNETEHVLATDQLQQVLSIEKDEMKRLLQEKRLFAQKLREIFSRPEMEEENIYRISEDPEKWVKIKIIANEKSTLGIAIDVTEEIREKKKIKQDRDYDPLTRIFNRKAAQRSIEKQIQVSQDLKTAAILMFDLDNLKIINDTYGHKWGDIYIKAAAQHLEKVAGDQKILGRRSGDEFVLFLYGFSDKEAIRTVIDGFYKRLKMEPLVFPDGESKPITISSGLMWVEDSELTYDDLLQHADEALYKAKRFHKGTCCESQFS